MKTEVITGDCVEKMRDLPENSVDSVVTDPPYGLEFMGKEWDNLSADPVSKSWNTKGRSKTGVPTGNKSTPGGRSQAKTHFHDNPRCRKCGRATQGRDTVKGFKVCSCEEPEVYAPSTSASKQQVWHEAWAREALRVLKPGGYLLAFGGTRTYHRLACAIEDAGFEIRDSITWLYGSGFPKSHDVSKAMDKMAPREGLFKDFARHFADRRKASGFSQKEISARFPSKTGGLTGCVWNWENAATVPTLKQWHVLQPLLGLSDEFGPLIERVEAERAVVGVKHPRYNTKNGTTFGGDTPLAEHWNKDTAPATPQAQQWQGWGTALKPAHEPIVMARKPLSEGTVARNVLEHGTGAINVDGCRVSSQDSLARTRNYIGNKATLEGGKQEGYFESSPSGRWPANLILSHHEDCNGECVEGCPVAELDRQSGTTRKRHEVRTDYDDIRGGNFINNESRRVQGDAQVRNYAGEGGASRFFYVAKASRRERNLGLDSTEIITVECHAWDREVQKVQLRVDTGRLPPTVIAGFGIKRSDACEWSTFLFGNGTTAPSLVESKFTILTGISLIIESPTLKWLTRSRTSASIADASYAGENGGSPAEGAENSNTYVSFTSVETVSLPGVEDAPSGTPWIIGSEGVATSNHPTVKPIALMRYLVRMVCPPGGTVLDPFTGSGSTGCAAVLEGMDFIGIEREEEYVAIAEKRIAHYEEESSSKLFA